MVNRILFSLFLLALVGSVQAREMLRLPAPDEDPTSYHVRKTSKAKAANKQKPPPEKAGEFYKKAAPPTPVKDRPSEKTAATRLKPNVPEKKPAVTEKRLIADFDRLIKGQRWDEAAPIGERLLSINPQNTKVKQKMEVVRAHLFEQASSAGRQKENEGDLSGAIAWYSVALHYKQDAGVSTALQRLQKTRASENSRRARETYRQALTANLNGNLAKAMALCRKTLELDPDNLHAQKMLERLKTRLVE